MVTPWLATWQRLWRDGPDKLSRAAPARLGVLDWHRSHGANVSRTARHFGYSQPTVYRWLARYDPFHLASLQNEVPNECCF